MADRHERHLVAGQEFDIGVEVIYVTNDDAHRHFDPNNGYPFLANGDAAWLGRMKISRAF